MLDKNDAKIHELQKGTQNSELKTLCNYPCIRLYSFAMQKVN